MTGKLQGGIGLVLAAGGASYITKNLTIDRQFLYKEETRRKRKNVERNRKGTKQRDWEPKNLSKLLSFISLSMVRSLPSAAELPAKEAGY